MAAPPRPSPPGGEGGTAGLAGGEGEAARLAPDAEFGRLLREAGEIVREEVGTLRRLT